MTKPRRIPVPGERFMMCCHVQGSPITGFDKAHILCVSNEAGATARCNDGRDLDIRWFILCDACDVAFESREDCSIEGRDGTWPEGAVLLFDDCSLN